MFNIRKITNRNPFKDDLEEEIPSNCSSASSKRNPHFIRVPIAIAFTVVAFILLIAGTAATAISFPPKPLLWFSEDKTPENAETALDGNYKLIGPLLLTSGLFILIVTISLCVVVTKDMLIASRSIQPSSVMPKTEGLSVLGGPFYLATPNPTLGNPDAMVPFAFSRHLWTLPNAPIPEFAIDDNASKSSQPRAVTATLERSSQPPYNPDLKIPNDEA